MPVTRTTCVATRAGPWPRQTRSGCVFAESGAPAPAPADATGSTRAYYPDMVVICSEGQTHPRDPDGGVVNPRLIAEVTRPNPEKRDRGVKLDDYRLLSSLREYLIVSHVRHEIEIWTRADADVPWSRRVVTTGQVAELGIGVAIDVDDLYREPLPPR